MTLEYPEHTLAELEKIHHRGLLTLLHESRPDWTEELPVERTRDPGDYPVTVTKIAAVLQHRRIRRGAWWSTLRTKAEWRNYYLPQIPDIQDRISKLRDLIKAADDAKPTLEHPKLFSDMSSIETAGYLEACAQANEGLAFLLPLARMKLEELEAKLGMIKRGAED